MKYREVVIFNGDKYTVPQNIQRIDHLATHGWQLRYGGTKLFSDHTTDGSGAAASLEAAMKGETWVRVLAPLDSSLGYYDGEDD